MKEIINSLLKKYTLPCLALFLTGSVNAQILVSNYFQLTPQQAGHTNFPSNTTGTGKIVVIGDPANPTIQFDIQYFNLLEQPDNQSAIRGPALPGESGNVVIELDNFLPGGTNGTITGSVSLPATNLNDLKQGLLYVNITSASYNGGQIRGQIPGDKGDLFAASFDKLRPKDGKKLSFNSAKGFPAKGRLLKAAGTSNVTVDGIYAFLSVPGGTNNGATNYGMVKLAQKAGKKGQLKKNIAYTFRTDKTSGKVGVGTPALSKGTPVEVVFVASNSIQVLYHTNKLTINKIK